jgi:flagellum-specific ATP synthase
MGGYHPGNDPELDQAVVIVPRIYEALRQDPSSPASDDAFLDLAQALKQQDQ